MKIGASGSGGTTARIAAGIEAARRISSMVPAHLMEAPMDLGSFAGDEPADLVIELRIRSAQLDEVLRIKSDLMIQELPDAQTLYDGQYSREYERFLAASGATHTIAVRKAKLSTAELRRKLLSLEGLVKWCEDKQKAITSQIGALRKRLEYIEQTMFGNTR